jgi:hypothetical protein
MSPLQLQMVADMAPRALIPFGGIFGWLVDLTVARKVSAAKADFTRSALASESYYVAEQNQGRALRLIRLYAGAGRDAELTPIRSLSRKEIDQLGLKPGEVKRG